MNEQVQGMGVLLLLVVAGLLGPTLSSTTRRVVPVIVGEILAGVVLGPHVLAVLDPSDPVLRVLHDAGFALLMFDIGMHLPLRNPDLRRGLRRGLWATAVSLPPAVLLAWAIGGVAGFGANWIAISVVLATCSAAVALPALRESGGVTSGQRSSLAAWLLAADIVTVMLLPLVAQSGSPLRVLGASVAVSAAAAAATYGLHLLGRSAWWKKVRKASKAGLWGWDLRVALVLVFGLTWVAVWLGASPLVAGFAAGVAVSVGGKSPKRLAQQVVGVGDAFLIPAFFIVLGMGLDLGAALSSTRGLSLVAMLVAASVLVHVTAARVTGMPWGAGLVATAQMGVPAALVAIGLQQGWMQGWQGASFITAAVISVGVSAWGVALLRRGEQRARSSQPAAHDPSQGAGEQPEGMPDSQLDAQVDGPSGRTADAPAEEPGTAG